MLYDAASEGVEVAPVWAPENGRIPMRSPGKAPEPQEPPAYEGACSGWQEVDRALRTIARRRAALDAEEAQCLREAEALQIWRPLGMVSAIDYLERVLGYPPRAAQERLRVARALGALPELTAALAQGALPFCAVRELTRVATPATEPAWVAAAMGKNVRQIEELVAGHCPGDGPEDPPDPELRTHVVRLELSAETFAQLRQVHRLLDDEHGRHLSDDQLIAALCEGVLDGAPAVEPTGRAKFQIAVTVCQRCRQGWQDGAGAKLAIDAAAAERATCDAQHIGSLDGEGPERASQDVPPSVVRFVWRRDGGRCRVPGCRSARGLEIHHLVHRADGGSHDALNLALVCSACHLAHHRGALTISGTADQLEVRRPAEASAIAHVGKPVGAISIASTGIHADATSDPISIVPAGVHVGAPSEASSVATTRAPVDVSSEAHGKAHVGAPSQAGSVATTGAHVDASSEAHGNAHVGAPPEASSVASTGTHVGAPSKLDTAVLRAQSKAALVGLGWKPAIADAAVGAALAALGPGAPLERLIFEALRRCPPPRT